MGKTINKIIIHCSATKEGVDFKINDVRQWHKARGFIDVGYHYVIELDGTIRRGRDEDQTGSHCKGYNKNSIGICYIGGLDRDGNPKDTRTSEQKHAMKILIESLKDKYNNVTIHGHNEFSNKACPCFNVKHYLILEKLI